MSQLMAEATRKMMADNAGEHVPLGRWLRVMAWGVPAAAICAAAGVAARADIHVGVLGALLIGLALLAWAVLVSGIRVAAQWERGVILSMGRYTGAKGPGVFYVLPMIENVRFIDMRILTITIPSQKVMTRDNVPAEVDGVLFCQVVDAGRATTGIKDYQFAILQYAQASLRDVVGGLSLDELLSERERIQQAIGQALEVRAKDWGIHIDSVRLLDIEMPEDLKRMMSRQASAEREKRATITKAEGDKLAAANLSEAARLMAETPGAMQLRTLQTIDGLGPSPSNTVLLYPVELVQALTDFSRMFRKADSEAGKGGAA
ncbi:MAG: slipin family protein [Planctomycetes bacterium]|nr:slipin family protein [Planctomycetota bacterium]